MDEFRALNWVLGLNGMDEKWREKIYEVLKDWNGESRVSSHRSKGNTCFSSKNLM